MYVREMSIGVVVSGRRPTTLNLRAASNADACRLDRACSERSSVGIILAVDRVGRIEVPHAVCTGVIGRFSRVAGRIRLEIVWLMPGRIVNVAQNAGDHAVLPRQELRVRADRDVE